MSYNTRLLLNLKVYALVSASVMAWTRRDEMRYEHEPGPCMRSFCLPYFFVLSGFSPRPGVALCGRCLESEIGPLNAPIPIVTKGGF